MLDSSLEQALIGPDARRLTFEQLRTFVAVAEDGGFQRAAALLNRSQSAVTQSLRKLEEILGCRLLDRRQGHVGELTDEGQQFLGHARELLARAAEALQSVRAEPLDGVVRVGVPDDFSARSINQLLGQCVARHPRLRLEVRSAQSAALRELYEDEQLDIALYKQVGDPASLPASARILQRESICWVHRLRRSIDAFDVVPLIGFAEGCGYRRAATAALAELGKPWYFAYASASYSNVRSAVIEGLGVAVFQRSAVSEPIQILARDEGFPALPGSALVMLCRPGDPTREQIAAMLERSRATLIDDKAWPH
ncbi:MAG: LysR substrate-binding domain-containing protein [Burkholderiaceae bacterium]